MISFVTCIKLGKGYEDFIHRLSIYMESISTFCKMEHEIIVVEEESNGFHVKNVLGEKVRVVEYTPTYANPHGYPMIEAYAKNVGIQTAKYDYVCVTNADIFFHEDFFANLVFKKNTLHRYPQYEIPVPSEWTLEAALKLTPEAKWINSCLQKMTIQAIAYKSGDIMMMHRDCWNMIKGFPENEVWVHSDLIVCNVAYNNGFSVHVGGKVFTYEQARSIEEQPHEIQTAMMYRHSKTTNL
jgi:hypothetical protein